jgi:arylsulfatase A-like enzyme
MHDVAPEAIRWLEKNRKKKFFLHIQAYDAHCPFGYPRKNVRFDPGYDGDIDFSRCYWTFDKTKAFTIVQNEKVEKYYNLIGLDGGQTKADADEGKHMTLPQSYVWQRFNERDIEHMVALYDGKIFNADRQIEKIFEKLKKLRLTDHTIIVFLSEHGDMFGKYGRFMRGGPLSGTFYDDVLHFPLVIYHPNLKPKKVNSLASLIDIAPTLLEFLGYRPPPEFEGQSLVPILKNDNVQRKVFSGTQFIPPENDFYFNFKTLVTAVRDEKWKLIKEEIRYDEGVDINYELFNIEDDAQELYNLAEENIEQLKKSNEILNEWTMLKLKKDSIFRKK